MNVDVVLFQRVLLYANSRRISTQLGMTEFSLGVNARPNSRELYFCKSSKPMTVWCTALEKYQMRL